MGIKYKSSAGNITTLSDVKWKNSSGTIVQIAKVLWKNASGLVTTIFSRLTPNIIWSKSDISIVGSSVAVDSAGNVFTGYSEGYVMGNVSFRKMNSEGTVLWSNTYEIPSTYTLPTFNIHPHSTSEIYCGGGYTASNLVKSLRKFNSSGSELWYSSNLIACTGIVTNSSGQVFSQHAYSSTGDWKFIVKWSSTGSQQWYATLPSYQNSNWGGVALDSSGNVYGAVGDHVLKYNSSGIYVSQLYFGTIYKIKIVNDILYIIGSSKIVKYNVATNTPIWSKSTSAISIIPRSLEIDNLGNIYVGFFSGYIYKFNSNCTEIWRKLGDGICYGIAVDNAYAVHCAWQGKNSNITTVKYSQ